MCCTSCANEPSPVKAKASPVKVNDEIIFGRYIIRPPKNYWFYPKKYPSQFKTSKDIFLVTFWKDKDDLVGKHLKAENALLNFGVSANIYKDFSDYYYRAQKAGVNYKDVPEEMDKLKTMPNWSCKQPAQGIFGIECISLRDELITIGIYGFEKATVMSNYPVFLRMLESFRQI